MILFGIGSPILLDYEETLYRLGGSIAAGIKNRDGATHVPDGIPVLNPARVIRNTLAEDQ